MMNPDILENIRNVAIAGPYGSGKTSLLESLLFVTGTTTRKGTIKDGNTVSDYSPEAKERQMSVEVSAASAVYQDIQFTFLDCPGSIEFAQEAYNAMVGCGSAVVVCEADTAKVLTLAPLFKFLDDWEIPHVVFINKMERAKSEFTDVLNALKSVSTRPLVPQQYPIYQDQELIGYIDLVTEQAYQYHLHSPADHIPFPGDLRDEEHAARQEMLETLANFDDHLLEELMEEIEPPQAEILEDLKQELSADLIVPVFFGVAEQDYGVRPLMDSLLKESPTPSVTAARRDFEPKNQTETVVQVLKTYFTQQGGRLSLIRIWQGSLKDGDTLNGVRIGGLYRMLGQQQKPLQSASVGEIVAVGRLEGIQTGDTVTNRKSLNPLPKADLLEPVYCLAIAAENRKDEVKLSSAMGKLQEEDPSLSWEQNADTQEILLWAKEKSISR